MPVKNILVVDDSPTERFFAVDLLTKAGYNVATADDKLEAAGHELAVTGGGIAGGVACGAVAGAPGADRSATETRPPMPVPAVPAA